MPASVITRAMTITYGGVTVGTGTSYHLTGLHFLEKTYETISVGFDVLVQDDVLATFLSDCATLEAAYRTKNSDLQIALAGSNHTNLTHSGNTGFNGRASITKIGQLGDSNNSRFYRCEVTAELPADETGKNARRDSGYRLSADESGVQTLEVTAVYTASGATAALAQAQAQFPGYASGLQPAGDWDESSQISYEVDDENKVVTASVVYREIIHNQSSGAANDTSLVGEQITVTTQRTSAASDKGRNAKALVSVQLSFDTGVRASSTKDLKSKWESIRSYLVSVAETQSGVAGLTVVDENPAPDPSRNRLAGTLLLVGADGSALLASQTTLGTSETSGKIFIPVANGDPLGADVHDGPQIHTLVLQSTILELDTAGAGRDSSFAAFEDAKDRMESLGYIVVQTEAPLDFRFEHTGHNFSSRINLRRRQRRVLMRKVNQANQASSGGGFRTRVRASAPELP